MAKSKVRSAADKLLGLSKPEDDNAAGAAAVGDSETQKKISSREKSAEEKSPGQKAALAALAEGLALGPGHKEWLGLGADLVMSFPDLSGRQLQRHRHRWLMEQGGRPALKSDHVGSWSQMSARIRAQFNGAVALARVQVRRAEDEAMF